MKKNIFALLLILFSMTIFFIEDGTAKSKKRRNGNRTNTIENELPYNFILSRPTNKSVTISALVNNDMIAFFEYGVESKEYHFSTESYVLKADTPVDIVLSDLTPNTRYFYRMQYQYSESDSLLSSEEYSFRTQRPPGQPFIFDIVTDSHLYDKKCNPEYYLTTLNNVLGDKPDFLLDLGDTFGDDHDTTITFSEMQQLHLDQRFFFGSTCHSVPLFLCLGNHEAEMGYYLNGSENSLAVYGTNARKYYYSNPVPGEFYSGNNTVEEFVGLPENYYSWQWGDALFVVLDVYRYNYTSPKPRGWDWTLGEQQYNWFRHTLEQSKSKYKFVFAHHVLGQTRGAIKWAKLYEWGGHKQDGETWDFENQRPGWETPIHQLMVKDGVTIFFQGHDHLFAKEELDGLIYQECPMPSDASLTVGMANASHYTGDVFENSGHLRVSVRDTNITVDYIRAFPVDGEMAHQNNSIAYSYNVSPVHTSVDPMRMNCVDPVDSFMLGQNYPNPFNPVTQIPVQLGKAGNLELKIYNSMGQMVNTLADDFYTRGEHTFSWDGLDEMGNKRASGLYFYRLRTQDQTIVKKALLID